MFEITMFDHVSERDFFSPTCSKFAVDWNSKISQNVKIWVFLKKKDFRKKNLLFFQIR